MQIIRLKRFVKSYQKLQPKVQEKVIEVLRIFALQSDHPDLHNHALLGEYLGCRSIDVLFDLRIIFRELSDGRYEIIELIDVGTHSQLYK